MGNSFIQVRRLESQPAAVVLTFARGEKRNALREADMVALSDRLNALHHDPETKVIIITGSGEAFTSGQDVNDINAFEGAQLARLFERDVDILSRIVMMPKLVIAAVNGTSAGFGNHLAICSDYCVVKRSAAFHFTGIAKSIPSPMLGTLLLPMTVGLKRAKAIYLRGGKYSPEQALADGFCNAVVEDEQWDQSLEALAAEFCSRNSQVMALNKHLLNQAAMDMLGAVKLSGMAGAGLLSAESKLPTGRVSN